MSKTSDVRALLFAIGLFPPFFCVFQGLNSDSSLSAQQITKMGQRSWSPTLRKRKPTHVLKKHPILQYFEVLIWFCWVWGVWKSRKTRRRGGWKEASRTTMASAMPGNVPSLVPWGLPFVSIARFRCASSLVFFHTCVCWQRASGMAQVLRDDAGYAE